jgi:hypothetical protein
MPRATIIVDMNFTEEVQAVEAWFERWGVKIRCDENQGCGCCVNIYPVEAPQEALAELPEQLISS